MVDYSETIEVYGLKVAIYSIGYLLSIKLVILLNISKATTPITVK